MPLLMPTTYNLNFMHPQYGTTLNADIDGAFTVQEVLERLRLSGFMGQTDQDYDLQFMGQTLERQTLLMDIPELYDGAVLRLLALPDPTSVAPVSTLVLLHLKHPTEPYLLPVELPVDALLTQFVDHALACGFVTVSAPQLYVTKGSTRLDLQHTASQNALQSGDYLQLHLLKEEEALVPDDAIPAVPVVTLADLQTQLHQLQLQLQPATDDGNAPLPQPEQESVFEPLEKLVQSLRGDAKPLAPIEARPSRVWWVLVGLLVGAIAVAVFLILSERL